MPPDPILAILSLVGLFVYAAIGGVVAAFVLRVCSPQTYFRHLAGVYVYDYPKETWVFLGMVTTLWPAVVALAVPIAILAGPFWIAKRTGAYVARAQIKEAG